MTLRKYAHGQVLEETPKDPRDGGGKTASAAWTDKDKAELAKENQK